MMPIKVGDHKPIKIANNLLSVFVNRYTENKILLTTEASTKISAKGILGFVLDFIDINIK